jgi:hypothetical protein
MAENAYSDFSFVSIGGAAESSAAPPYFLSSEIGERHHSAFSKASEGGGAEVTIWLSCGIGFRGNSSDLDPYAFAVNLDRQLEPLEKSSSCFGFGSEAVPALELLREIF